MPTPKDPRRSNRLVKNFVQTMRRHRDWPVLLSEGDSWFAFPIRKNIIDFVEGMGNFALLRLERSGDEILTILSGKQKAKLRRYFRKYPVDAILFSGGGNDIVGANFLPLLNEKRPGSSWQDCINRGRAKRRLGQVRELYLDLIQLRDDNRPECIIFVHGYDYPIPSNRGVSIAGVRLSGPWMKPSMEEKRIDDPEDQKKIARWFIEQFNVMLRKLKHDTSRLPA